MTNYNGFDLEREALEQDGTEYHLGAVSLPCLAKNMQDLSFDEVKKYLPKGEVQRSDYDDMQYCASGSPLNILETKFNYLIAYNLLTEDDLYFLSDNGYIVDGKIQFSDAFVAINAGTTRQGTSLKAPLQAIHAEGLIPKAMLPLESDMTFEDYYNPRRITPQMIYLGKEFLARFNINYEKVYDFSLNESLDVAGFAWPNPIDGVYPRSENRFNHAFNRLRPSHKVFDTYTDPVDGDFIKDLAPDYKFLHYGYRLLITRNTRKRQNWLVELLVNLFR